MPASAKFYGCNAVASKDRRKPYLATAKDEAGASIQIAHDGLAEAEHPAEARERHQADLARLARLEAHGRAGGNVEAAAARLGAVELQGRVGFSEMVVRADLDRPVAGVGDRQRDGGAAGVELDVAGDGDDFAGDMRYSSLRYGQRHAAGGDQAPAARASRLRLRGRQAGDAEARRMQQGGGQREARRIGDGSCGRGSSAPCA